MDKFNIIWITFKENIKKDKEAIQNIANNIFEFDQYLEYLKLLNKIEIFMEEIEIYEKFYINLYNYIKITEGK